MNTRWIPNLVLALVLQALATLPALALPAVQRSSTADAVSAQPAVLDWVARWRAWLGR